MPKQSTKDVAIDNRAVMTDTIHSVMHDHYRAFSIDRLLCRPRDAIAMATEVCRRMSLKPTGEQINAVCWRALASRKAGDLGKDKN